MRPATDVSRLPGRRVHPLRWLTETSYTGMARRKALLAYVFLLPSVSGILIFTAGPVIASLTLSLFSWNIITPPTPAGTANYQQLFQDPQVLLSFGNTAIFVTLAVTLQTVLGLFLALGMRQKMATWLRYAFRSAFFLPLLTSGATVSIVMAYMFHREFGVINYYLGFIGIRHIPWLTAVGWSMITVVLTCVWQQLGFTFIVFTGGLGTISKEVLEAADVDGATGWQRLMYVTLPMLSPTTLFVVVIGIIGALQVFDQPYVMTQGGPGDATLTVVMLIYRAAFQNLQIGYASAIAVILFLVILAVTALQFWFSKRWVFYQ